MTSKTALQQQVEQKFGLVIEKVETAQQLEAYLDSGLAKLYQTVFSEAPYFEKFSIDEIKDDFQKCLSDNGSILVALDPAKNDAPVAFISAAPLKSKFNLAVTVMKYVDPEKSAYLAEDGVAQEYRCRGLSSNMKKILMETCSFKGFTEMLIRTSQNSYNQINSINKTGGTVILGLIQDVESKRLDGTVTKDKRSLYRYDLNVDAADTIRLDDVIILRQGKKDIAYLPKFFLDLPDRTLGRLEQAWLVRQTYPGVSDVLFGNPYAKRSRLKVFGNFLLGNIFNKESIAKATKLYDGDLNVSKKLLDVMPSFVPAAGPR